MEQFEYKTVVFEITRASGFWKNKPTNDGVPEISKKLNELGKDGWQLIGIFPVTDGGSPAQISRALHYLMRAKAATS